MSLRLSSDDNLYVLNVLVQRCLFLQIEDCENLLRCLFTKLQQLHRQYDDLNARSRVLTANRFCCPREETARGRPRYSVSNDAISGLHRIHRSWREVAENIGVYSYRTVLRRGREFGMSVSNRRGPRSSYSDVNNDQLCQHISILQSLPNAGETFVLGALRNRGLNVQRFRVRDAIRQVDPLSRAMRRSVAVLRRVYNVPCPNALWYV